MSQTPHVHLDLPDPALQLRPAPLLDKRAMHLGMKGEGVDAAWRKRNGTSGATAVRYAHAGLTHNCTHGRIRAAIGNMSDIRSRIPIDVTSLAPLCGYKWG